MYIEGDVPSVVTTNGNGGNGNSGFGFGNDAWVLIILFALIFGWNGNGGLGGNNGGGYSGVADNYVLATDFATIERKLDGVNNGLCDGFYAQNTNMLNGFASVQQTLCQGFSGVNSTINTNGYETRGAITDLGYRLQDCCCTTQRAIDGVKFENAQNTCAITTAINNSTRDIVENQNANYRALHDEIIANRIEDKNNQISELKTALNNATLRASQAEQSNFIINELKPCPKPAYITCNPYQSAYGVGLTNNGCGCC